jgi:hypothetical protein
MSAIPAISYMNAVKQWAHARGMKFFTYNDMRKALASYELFAAKLN